MGNIHNVYNLSEFIMNLQYGITVAAVLLTNFAANADELQAQQYR